MKNWKQSIQKREKKNIDIAALSKSAADFKAGRVYSDEEVWQD